MLEAQESVTALAQLYALSIVLTIALEQVFDTQLFHRLLGKGTVKDGVVKPSVFLPYAEVRPYIASLVGIGVALIAHLEVLRSILNVDMASGGLGEAGLYVDRVLTGIFLGGGAKTVKRVAKAVTTAREQVVK